MPRPAPRAPIRLPQALRWWTAPASRANPRRAATAPSATQPTSRCGPLLSWALPLVEPLWRTKRCSHGRRMAAAQCLFCAAFGFKTIEFASWRRFALNVPVATIPRRCGMASVSRPARTPTARCATKQRHGEAAWLAAIVGCSNQSGAVHRLMQRRPCQRPPLLQVCSTPTTDTCEACFNGKMKPTRVQNCAGRAPPALGTATGPCATNAGHTCPPSAALPAPRPQALASSTASAWRASTKPTALPVTPATATQKCARAAPSPGAASTAWWTASASLCRCSPSLMRPARRELQRGAWWRGLADQLMPACANGEAGGLVKTEAGHVTPQRPIALGAP